MRKRIFKKIFFSPRYFIILVFHWLIILDVHLIFLARLVRPESKEEPNCR